MTSSHNRRMSIFTFTSLPLCSSLDIPVTNRIISYAIWKFVQSKVSCVASHNLLASTCETKTTRVSDFSPKRHKVTKADRDNATSIRDHLFVNIRNPSVDNVIFCWFQHAVHLCGNSSHSRQLKKQGFSIFCFITSTDFAFNLQTRLAGRV